MIRVVEGRGTTIEGSVVEIPFRRSKFPDELRKVVTVFVITRLATIRGEVELIPPLKFGVRWERHLACRLAADQIAAHRDKRLAAFGPERRDDIRRPRAPIESGDNRFVDLEGVHQRNRIEGDDRLLAVSKRVARKKRRR